MRRLTLASIVSACMVPALFWSQDSSAIPAFARKYQTSCYTCHAGFPARNAFGEAFKANGYRWPGGEDADHAKQEQVKLGADGWKKTFPASPWPSDIPGFAPFSVYLTGPLINYSGSVHRANGTLATPQTLNWAGPFDARILTGGTIGENIGFFGGFESFATNGTTPKSNFRATWSFAPGVMLGVGNAFSFMGSGEDESSATAILPSTGGTGLEFSYAAGEKSGGLRVYAGTVSNGTNSAAITVSQHLDDIRYGRVEYKIGGAGVLSGAGGTYGNEYVGLDNAVEIGASVVNFKPGIYTNTYGYDNNKTVYGFDVSANHGSFSGGAEWSRGVDSHLNNYGLDAAYFVYPWLQGKVAYRHIKDQLPGGVDRTNPSYALTLTAWTRANVFIAGAYTFFDKGDTSVAGMASGLNKPDTFKLNVGIGF
ncbi:MAG: hypothetical protein FDX21_01470 [Chlorobium sp.]|nr:MAG: hypothetical protein FDX21_01470 [Chlorobium sp.]